MAEIISFMLLGMIIGVFLLVWLLNVGLKNMQQKTEDQFVDKALKIWKDTMIPLSIEKVNDSFYAYNDDSGEYICQGADFDELQANFALRYPDNGSYIKEKYLHFFPEELKKAKEQQEKANRAVANLENPENDIVFLDDDK